MIRMKKIQSFVIKPSNLRNFGIAKSDTGLGLFAEESNYFNNLRKKTELLFVKEQ